MVGLVRARPLGLRPVRDRAWGLGVLAEHGGSSVVQIDEGKDEFTAYSRFELGSITKTMVAALLGDAVGRGECSLDTTVGELLGGRVGSVSGTTLLQLATHTSGLPRLPVGYKPSDRSDPYADLDVEGLLTGLAALGPLTPGQRRYSNLGFILLALLLERITSADFEPLLQERLLRPVGMANTTTQLPAEGRLIGYRKGLPTPWWTGLPGAGGVTSTLEDMGAYLRAVLTPEQVSDRFAAAMDLATRLHLEGKAAMGLAWMHQGGGWWHNGSTYGFHTFACIFRPTSSAVFLVANAGEPRAKLDRTGFRIITKLARGQII